MATFSPQVKYTCTSFYYVRPLPPLERALHLCLHYGGPAGPEALAAATQAPLSDVYRAIVELLRHGLITLADTSQIVAAGAQRQQYLPPKPATPIRSALCHLSHRFKQACQRWSDQFWYGRSLDARQEGQAQ